MVLELLWTILQELLRCSAAEPVVGNPILVAKEGQNQWEFFRKEMVLDKWGLWGYTC